MMRQPGAIASFRSAGAFRGVKRDRLAQIMALVTTIVLGLAFYFSKDTRFLMPGPLASGHAAIKDCGTCHTRSGNGKVSWIKGVALGDPLADSKACLACHNMPRTALNPHSASGDVLKRSTERVSRIAAQSPMPLSARVQSVVFPTQNLMANDLTCAVCHQEHQGGPFKLSQISNEQCRACHVMKFDSFDRHHPEFSQYPFKRRTRIIYDHAGHFKRHFPEFAKKNPGQRIPATCSDCHNSSGDKRIMAVDSFEKTCATCHFDQIIGKERASGPKGVAFLTLPGLDLASLKKKNALIGEWPEASEAPLTPFMKVLISRSERGRGIVKAAEGLNLQDLTEASADDVKIVTELALEIKKLFYALIAGKASDVLGDLTLGGGAKLSPALVAELTASLPRDVVVGAQQQWLPNLAAEMAEGPGAAGRQSQSSSSSAMSAPRPAGSASSDNKEQGIGAAQELNAAPSAAREREAAPASTNEADDGETARKTKRDPPACVMRIFGQCLLSKEPQDRAEAAHLGGPDATVERSDAANAETNRRNAVAAGEQPQSSRANQSDELLLPTDDELREIKARTKGSANGASPDAARGSNGAAPASNAAANGETSPAHANGIEGIDAESWAEYGGWYRQDFAILYRPTGHKDKFIHSWLSLTGLQAAQGGHSPAASIFDFLTNKDAQGSCVKCHSIDDVPGKGRAVNFSPSSVESKQGRFTNFLHEPHFALLDGRTGLQDNQGCFSCHNLENNPGQEGAQSSGTAKAEFGSAGFSEYASSRIAASTGKARAENGGVAAEGEAAKEGSPFLKSYEQGNPENFVSNFRAVKKEICQTCHKRGKARQDCLLCHRYHVNGAVSPVTKTEVPKL